MGIFDNEVAREFAMYWSRKRVNDPYGSGTVVEQPDFSDESLEEYRERSYSALKTEDELKTLYEFFVSFDVDDAIRRYRENAAREEEENKEAVSRLEKFKEIIKAVDREISQGNTEGEKGLYLRSYRQRLEEEAYSIEFTVKKAEKRISEMIEVARLVESKGAEALASYLTEKERIWSVNKNNLVDREIELIKKFDGNYANFFNEL